MEQPGFVMNPLAIAVAVVVAFVIGGLWFGPLFGRRWAALMGMDLSKRPTRASMIRAFGLQAIGLTLTALVMAHLNQVWRPSAWGVGTDHASYVYGFFGGFMAWIGFQVPLQLGKVSWESRPWQLFLINTSHDFVVLQVISQIIANWR